MQRLLVVADNSLILGAIAIGLRESGEFKLLGHVDHRTPSWRSIVDAAPDVVLIDDMDRDHAGPVLGLVRQIKDESPGIAVIVLTMAMDSEWLNAVFAAGAIATISVAGSCVSFG